jgi:sensor domain CHASE-containing protein
MVVGGTFLVLFLGQWGLARSIILRGYGQIETERATTNATRMEKAFNQEVVNLQTGVWDWGVWDDTYEFMQTRNADYLETNFIEETFLSLGIQMVAIFDRDQNLVYGQTLEFEVCPNTSPIFMPRSNYLTGRSFHIS